MTVDLDVDVLLEDVLVDVKVELVEGSGGGGSGDREAAVGDGVEVEGVDMGVGEDMIPFAPDVCRVGVVLGTVSTGSSLAASEVVSKSSAGSSLRIEDDDSEGRSVKLFATSSCAGAAAVVVVVSVKLVLAISSAVTVELEFSAEPNNIQRQSPSGLCIFYRCYEKYLDRDFNKTRIMFRKTKKAAYA